MEQGLIPHDGYYARLKAESAKTMKHLCGFHFEPTSRDGVRECIVKALEDGTTFEVAEVLLCATEWLHSCHELKEHTTK